MKDIAELHPLMLELLEDNIKGDPWEVTDRGREIIDEISDYAEQLDIFQTNKDRGEIFEGATARQVYGYMLDRVVNAPTEIFRDMSVVLIMPFLREKLRREKTNAAT